MAHSVSARKRIRQNEKHAERNRPIRTRITRSVRDAREAIEDGDAEAGECVREAHAALDVAARKNVIHKNAAARRKSRLTKALKASQS
ncbi:MAG TPA: 30S ribosomal protein S20 [Dehalococcoidia bacterium]|jgi:small subunit ribosomal protein S20|nr:30S ribosomal protein S20 [Dehalococcoidia bacterium]